MYVLVTCKFKKDRIESNREKVDTSFSPLYVNGHFLLDFLPQTLCSLSAIPMTLYIKFYQDLPTGFRDIQVQKCEIFVTPGQVTPKGVV